MVLLPTNKRHNNQIERWRSSHGFITTAMIAETTTMVTTNMWQECKVWASSLMPLGAVVVEKEKRRIAKMFQQVGSGG